MFLNEYLYQEEGNTRDYLKLIFWSRCILWSRILPCGTNLGIHSNVPTLCSLSYLPLLFTCEVPHRPLLTIWNDGVIVTTTSEINDLHHTILDGDETTFEINQPLGWFCLTTRSR